MKQQQLALLRTLLDEIIPRNRFYTAKLKPSGLSAENLTVERFIQACPFTFKHELVEDQAAFPLYGSNLTYPLSAYTRCHRTSGTSGRPLYWLDTPESWEGFIYNWTRIYHEAGVTSGDRVYFAFSFGPFIGFWLAFEAASKVGALAFSGGGINTSGRLQAILEHEITTLCCTPTYALRMAEVAAQEKIGLGRSAVKRIIVAGEPGGSIPATRKQIEDSWPRARVFDHHGMTETGPVTYQCRAQPGLLHVMDAAYFAEVVSPESGEPLPPGGQGELVLSTLKRNGSPLLRYRTGDIVEVLPTGTCGCGSDDLCLKGGILGRTDDMLIIRGVNVYPSAVEEILRDAGVTEYRANVARKGPLTELAIDIETPIHCQNVQGLRDEIQSRFHSALALRVDLTCVPTGSLPRYEMKAKRWIVTTA